MNWTIDLRFCLLLLLTVAVPATRAQLSTEDHLAEPGFWPTQPQTSRQAFAGSGACARCHPNMASAEKTPMGQTAMPASVADLLRSHRSSSFDSGGYQYKIETRQGASRSASQYTVTDRSRSLSYPLSWAFGTGRVGQSYLFKKDDAFYEARVTWFTHLARLGFTPARALSSPASLEEAMYRPVPPAEVLRCFSCHTTGANINGSFDEQHLVAGVHCEACHGPGANHVRAMDAMNADSKLVEKVQIVNSAHLSPTDQVEFCGACHSSWWDVKLAGGKGVSTTRSAPARLVTSKCWANGEDSRLTCTACHNPHQQLQTDASAYDKTCLQCHASRNVSGSRASNTQHPTEAACPVASARCTSCHMPKVFVPEMNDTFTDHRIRIARAGEPFPD